MATPLLSTKLYVSPVRPESVPRPRLIERLDEGLRLGHRLTLISAPAGFGKTTLTGTVADQPKLRGILSKIWDLNLTVISVTRLES